MSTKYRKRPVVIDAIQYTETNWADVVDFTEPQGFINRGGSLVIRTLEGDMFATPGDWIIKGVEEEFYPCKPDIFEKTYEAVD